MPSVLLCRSSLRHIETHVHAYCAAVSEARLAILSAPHIHRLDEIRAMNHVNDALKYFQHIITIALSTPAPLMFSYSITRWHIPPNFNPEDPTYLSFGLQGMHYFHLGSGVCAYQSSLLMARTLETAILVFAGEVPAPVGPPPQLVGSGGGVGGMPAPVNPGVRPEGAGVNNGIYALAQRAVDNVQQQQQYFQSQSQSQSQPQPQPAPPIVPAVPRTPAASPVTKSASTEVPDVQVDVKDEAEPRAPVPDMYGPDVTPIKQEEEEEDDPLKYIPAVLRHRFRARPDVEEEEEEGRDTKRQRIADEVDDADKEEKGE